MKKKFRSVCNCTAAVKWAALPNQKNSVLKAVDMNREGAYCHECGMSYWYEEDLSQDQWTRAMNKLQADATL